MKKEDLENLYIVKIRNGLDFYVVDGCLYWIDGHILRNAGDLLGKYRDNLKHIDDENKDIMQVYDKQRKKVYDRKEYDVTKADYLFAKAYKEIGYTEVTRQATTRGGSFIMVSSCIHSNSDTQSETGTGVCPFTERGDKEMFRYLENEEEVSLDEIIAIYEDNNNG